MYDEIFYALAVGGDVLRQKPYLDLCKYRTVLVPSEFHMFGKLKKNYLQGRQFPPEDTVKIEVQKLLREQDFFFYRLGLENLIVYFEKCLMKFEYYVEN
jgi:hypothetical protein